MILAARPQCLQSAGRTAPRVGVAFPIRATMKRTALVRMDRVPWRPVPEDETCSIIDSRARRSSRQRPRSIKGCATARGSSSSARSHLSATAWTSLKDEWPDSNASSPSSYGSATEPGAKYCGPDHTSGLHGARVRILLTEMLRRSAGDEHRHVPVVGRNKRLVRLSEGVSHGVAQRIEGRFHESHGRVGDGAVWLDQEHRWRRHDIEG